MDPSSSDSNTVHDEEALVHFLQVRFDSASEPKTIVGRPGPSTGPSSAQSSSSTSAPSSVNTAHLEPQSGAVSSDRQLLADLVAARAKYPQNEKLRSMQETMELRLNQEYIQKHHLTKFLDGLLKQAVTSKTNNPIQVMIRALETKVVQ
jgi:hypothetical protein